MRGADEHLVGGHARLRGGDFPGFIQHIGTSAEIIHDDHREFGRAIIEHHRAGVERIMRAVRHIRAMTAWHVQREYFRRDVHGGGSSAEV